MQKYLIFVLSLVLLPLSFATNFTVKAAGGSFTTISACAAAAVAGDTCTVFTGSYAGWTQATSGSNGLPITFNVNSGDTVTVTSGITISGRSWIIIGSQSGGCATNGTTVNAPLPAGTFVAGGCFNFQSQITGDASTQHVIISHNSTISALFRIPDSLGSTGADNIVSYNRILNNSTGNIVGLYVYGDRNRLEYNELSSTDGDCMNLGGTNLVIRHNYCHDVDGTSSGQHIDFIQEQGGGTAPAISFSLVEDNVMQNCINDGGNCHGFMIVRTGTGPVADGIILRYNYAQNIDGDCLNIGGVGDNVPDMQVYNNTCASEHLAGYNQSFDSTQGTTPNANILNNIAYDVENNSGSFYPFSATGVENGNIAYSGSTVQTWPAPYSAEGTYTALHSKNPVFVSYPSNISLQAGSPAINAGVALTTANGLGSNTTALIVNNGYMFQPGWTGVAADSIKIGSNPCTLIIAVTPATGAITLASALTWNSGDNVYLCQTSDGATVLNGATPDIGAIEFISTSTTTVTSPAPMFTELLHLLTHIHYLGTYE